MTWAGVTESSGRLRQLQENLADAMGSLGLRQEERGFRPHVTLGRVKFASQAAHFRSAVAAMAEMDFGVQHAEEVVAYTSQLTSDGPIYTPLAHAPLGG